MHISKIAVAMPRTKLDMQEVAEINYIPAAEAKVFERIFGLKTFARDKNINIEDLLTEAAQTCIARSEVSPLQIKMIMHAHTATQVSPPERSAILKVQKNISAHQAVAFGMSMHKCATAFTFFSLASQYCQTLQDDEFILLLIGDVTFAAILQYIPGSTVNGDAACAVLLSKYAATHQFIDVYSLICGEYAKGLWNDETVQREFEQSYTRNVAHVIEQLLKQNNLSLAHISLILPHNVNIISWQQITKHLSIPLQQIYLDNVPLFGHCFGADPFINLASAIKAQRIKQGDYYVLVTAGLGATFSAMLFQY